MVEVLGEEIDVAGLKRAIEAPRPVEVPLSEEESGPTQTTLPEETAAEAEAPVDGAEG